MRKAKLVWWLSGALVAAALVAAPNIAKASSSTPSASSHSSASHKPGHARPGATKTRKALPAGTHFIRKTCKTASCKAKHPSGSYMLPIKPKKGRGAA